MGLRVKINLVPFGQARVEHNAQMEKPDEKHAGEKAKSVRYTVPEKTSFGVRQTGYESYSPKYSVSRTTV